jgi:hypothetical protein
MSLSEEVSGRIRACGGGVSFGQVQSTGRVENGGGGGTGSERSLGIEETIIAAVELDAPVFLDRPAMDPATIKEVRQYCFLQFRIGGFCVRPILKRCG